MSPSHCLKVSVNQDYVYLGERVKKTFPLLSYPATLRQPSAGTFFKPIPLVHQLVEPTSLDER